MNVTLYDESSLQPFSMLNTRVADDHRTIQNACWYFAFHILENFHFSTLDMIVL